jgi:hypothetical protein
VKQESLEDEINYIKNDLTNFIKSVHKEIREVYALVESQKEQHGEDIKYLFAHLELKQPKKRECMECGGMGKKECHPISDCGQDYTCLACAGKGYRYL